MSSPILVRRIDLVSPQGCSLVVTRNDDKASLILMLDVGQRNGYPVTAKLDQRGWVDLLNCVALPPAPPPEKPAAPLRPLGLHRAAKGGR